MRNLTADKVIDYCFGKQEKNTYSVNSSCQKRDGIIGKDRQKTDLFAEYLVNNFKLNEMYAENDLEEINQPKLQNIDLVTPKEVENKIKNNNINKW